VAWSDAVCTGLQLANFWQDVARDFAIGRVYLPQEDRERFGYTREMLGQRETNEAFLRQMEFQVNRAREWLTRGLPLIAVMPGRMQVVIELFIRGGLQILREIERTGFRVWETRPIVKKRQFARLFTAASLRYMGRQAAGRYGETLRDREQTR
jgi:phytoene/squalene synthetase